MTSAPTRPREDSRTGRLERFDRFDSTLRLYVHDRVGHYLNTKTMAYQAQTTCWDFRNVPASSWPRQSPPPPLPPPGPLVPLCFWGAGTCWGGQASHSQPYQPGSSAMEPCVSLHLKGHVWPACHPPAHSPQPWQFPAFRLMPLTLVHWCHTYRRQTPTASWNYHANAPATPGLPACSQFAPENMIHP